MKAEKTTIFLVVFLQSFIPFSSSLFRSLGMREEEGEDAQKEEPII